MRKLELALELLSTLRALPRVAHQRRVAAYEVRGPVTVYIRADHSRVTVRRTLQPHVQIVGELRQAFGWEWVTERDEAGIYVVLKRRPLVGALASADLTLIVPPDAYLVFHLTPGSVHLDDFVGRLSVTSLDEGGVQQAPDEDSDSPGG
ncbi:MAG: hypothetical protein HPY64_12360 [Anaerolineae bacterium]|nr:hypothetical protein [Anaerolineae bacterium]